MGLFGNKDSDFKHQAAKSISSALTRGLKAVSDEFQFDEKNTDRMMRAFMKAFEGELSGSVGEDPGYFARGNKKLEKLLKED